MDIKNLVQSNKYKVILISLAALAVLFLTFAAGMRVGFHKATFSYQWGENYHKNFTGPRGGMLRGMFRDFEGKDFIDSHGASGQILNINPSTDSGQAEMVIKGQDGVEKIIVFKEDVAVSRFRETIKPSELNVDDYITVIGSPMTDGKVEAKFIRILSASSTFPMMNMMNWK